MAAGGGGPFGSSDGMYFDPAHGLYLPRNPNASADSTPDGAKSDADDQEETERLPALSGSVALAAILCAGLSLTLGLIAGNFLPGRWSELLATLPFLFLEYTTRLLASRTFALPGSAADIIRGRIWYLAVPGYAALLNIALDLTYALVRAVSGSVSDSLSLLALLNIVIGVGMGALIGRRRAPHPVWAVIATGYVASLLGGVLDVAILGRPGFAAIHDGAALGAVIMLNGAIFAAAGLAGLAVLRARGASRAPDATAPGLAHPQRGARKDPPGRITASSLAGALVILILAAGSGYAIISLARAASPAALRTGLYPVNRPLSSSGGIAVTLTQIRISRNGQAEFSLTYTNTGASPVSVSCAGYRSPAAGLVTLSSGQRIRSVATFCSADPGWHRRLASGASFHSYSLFPSSRGMTRPFTYSLSAGALSGQATISRLHRAGSAAMSLTPRPKKS